MSLDCVCPSRLDAFFDDGGATAYPRYEFSFKSNAIKIWWIGTLTVRPATKISSSVITVDSSDDEAFRNMMPSVKMMLDGECSSGL